MATADEARVMSSGDRLARSGPECAVALTLRRWSAAEWLGSEEAWGRLLARSNADALFLSWEWLTLWWHCFARALSAVPEILAFYRGDELVGVAPLYRRRLVRRGLLPATSVQLIGVSWRDPGALISEYLDIVASAAETDTVRRACARALLQEPGWTEWVIGFTAAGRQWWDAFAGQEPGQPRYLRELDPLVSYQADLSGGFGGYLRSLGQSTRRSVWNLRHRLARLGTVCFERLSPAEIDSGFSDLNRLHQLRWQRPAFAGASLEFHAALARRLARRGELVMSRLKVDGEAVSVLYDIRKGARQYNISMGFNPTLGGKLSIGLLHFGYAMEAAAEARASTYDFLAGTGQRSDYKRHLSQARRNLSSVQVLRGYLLPPLYRWHDRMH
jgi:CelD/BcsL family acetyltransferase involved in cellulose biosynthesis